MQNTDEAAEPFAEVNVTRSQPGWSVHSCIRQPCWGVADTNEADVAPRSSTTCPPATV